MITPGRNNDYGDIILVDARLIDFVEQAYNLNSNEEFLDFRNKHSDELWSFIKSEMQIVPQSDIDFLEECSVSLHAKMSDNYYYFKDCKYTQKFQSVTSLVNFVKENDIQLIGDLA